MTLELVEDDPELGIEIEEPPDFVGWFQSSDRCNCRPWDFFEPDDPQPPRWWWRLAALVLSAAEAEARRLIEERERQKYQRKG